MFTTDILMVKFSFVPLKKPIICYRSTLPVYIHIHIYYNTFEICMAKLWHNNIWHTEMKYELKYKSLCMCICDL